MAASLATKYFFLVANQDSWSPWRPRRPVTSSCVINHRFYFKSCLNLSAIVYFKAFSTINCVLRKGFFPIETYKLTIYIPHHAKLHFQIGYLAALLCVSLYELYPILLFCNTLLRNHFKIVFG